MYFCLLDLTCRSQRTCPNWTFVCIFLGVLSVLWRKEDNQNPRRRWPFTRGQGTVSSWWRSRSSKVKWFLWGVRWCEQSGNFPCGPKVVRLAEPNNQVCLLCLLCSLMWLFSPGILYWEKKKTFFYILIYLHVFLALPAKYRSQYLQNPLAFKYICSTATSHIMLQSDDNSIYGIYQTQVIGHKSLQKVSQTFVKANLWAN